MNAHPVIVTGDGSHTVVHPSGKETYHSRHGAITESRHVFIQHGLAYVSSQLSQISLLEIGFGTGLNAFLTYLYGIENPHLLIRYTGVEKFPLSSSLLSQLNYIEQLHAEQHRHVFENMHAGLEFSTGQFQFKLFQGDVRDFIEPGLYDLVYFDAFAPNFQPEMWSADIFQSLKEKMHPGGVLVTYCAQGQFQRTLKSLGFQVETLPGPPGKREMVRAIK